MKCNKNIFTILNPSISTVLSSVKCTFSFLVSDQFLSKRTEVRFYHFVVLVHHQLSEWVGQWNVHWTKLNYVSGQRLKTNSLNTYIIFLTLPVTLLNYWDQITSAPWPTFSLVWVKFSFIYLIGCILCVLSSLSDIDKLNHYKQIPQPSRLIILRSDLHVEKRTILRFNESKLCFLFQDLDISCGHFTCI